MDISVSFQHQLNTTKFGGGKGNFILALIPYVAAAARNIGCLLLTIWVIFMDSLLTKVLSYLYEEQP